MLFRARTHTHNQYPLNIHLYLTVGTYFVDCERAIRMRFIYKTLSRKIRGLKREGGQGKAETKENDSHCVRLGDFHWTLNHLAVLFWRQQQRQIINKFKNSGFA